jgi:hypothetical protein
MSPRKLRPDQEPTRLSSSTSNDQSESLDALRLERRKQKTLWAESGYEVHENNLYRSLCCDTVCSHRNRRLRGHRRFSQSLTDTRYDADAHTNPYTDRQPNTNTYAYTHADSYADANAPEQRQSRDRHAAGKPLL